MAEPNDSGNTPGFDPQADQRLGDSVVTTRLDIVFDLLRNARRRALLYFLYESDEQVVAMDDAVVAVAERTRTGTAPDEAVVRTDLHHSQMPRLEEAGVLEYDARQGDIRIWDYAPLLEWLAYAQRYEQA
jgi:hypothetical protein